MSAAAADAPPTALVTVAVDLTSRFRRLWAAIFAEPTPTSDWWRRDVLDQLPCGDCRGHAAAYAAARPPPWGDRPAFRRWALGLFNAVRERQGKPPIDAAGAERRWPFGGGSAGR